MRRQNSNGRRGNDNLVALALGAAGHSDTVILRYCETVVQPNAVLRMREPLVGRAENAECGQSTSTSSTGSTTAALASQRHLSSRSLNVSNDNDNDNDSTSTSTAVTLAAPVACSRVAVAAPRSPLPPLRNGPIRKTVQLIRPVCIPKYPEFASAKIADVPARPCLFAATGSPVKQGLCVRRYVPGLSILW